MSEANQFQHQMIDALPANLVVADDDTTTEQVSLFGTTALAIDVPGDLSGAEISFLVSHDGESYKPLRNPDGSLYKITGITTDGGNFPLLANFFAPWRNVKVVCGSSQSADAIFKIIPYSV
jgi:hypothetical protein